MTLVLKLKEPEATVARQAVATHTRPQMLSPLLAMLEEAGAFLMPMTEGTGRGEVDSYFIAKGIDQLMGRRLAERLATVPGVELAYEKPAEEPAKGLTHHPKVDRLSLVRGTRR